MEIDWAKQKGFNEDPSGWWIREDKVLLPPHSANGKSLTKYLTPPTKEMTL